LGEAPENGHGLPDVFDVEAQEDRIDLDEEVPVVEVEEWVGVGPVGLLDVLIDLVEGGRAAPVVHDPATGQKVFDVGPGQEEVGQAEPLAGVQAHVEGGSGEGDVAIEHVGHGGAVGGDLGSAMLVVEGAGDGEDVGEVGVDLLGADVG
jgi:hypothetical protein